MTTAPSSFDISDSVMANSMVSVPPRLDGSASVTPPPGFSISPPDLLQGSLFRGQGHTPVTLPMVVSCQGCYQATHTPTQVHVADPSPIGLCPEMVRQVSPPAPYKQLATLPTSTQHQHQRLLPP